MFKLVPISDKISVYQSALAGAGAGAFTRAVAQPLDVLKIRFQLQTEPVKNGAKYTSMLQATSLIIKEEGITTLWSGHIPAQLLSVSFGIVQFSTYEKLTELCKNDERFFYKHLHTINFTNGAVAAAIATVATYPLDTIRTRLIGEHKASKAYKGFYNAFETMIKVEGVAALYKGLLPTLSQVAPQAGIQFAVYKLLTDKILNKITYFQREGKLDDEVATSSLFANFISGSVAGVVAKTVVYPFDLVKKRLQIQGFQQFRHGFGKQIYCNGLLDCIRLTLIEEGFLALFKGYWPSMIKAALVTALHFTVYDEIRHILIHWSGNLK